MSSETKKARKEVVQLPETKQEILNQFKINEKDTGSAQVQIALLTGKILHLSEHAKVHKKDNHSKRGLVLAVSARKKLLSYLKRKDEGGYHILIEKLGLRK